MSRERNRDRESLMQLGAWPADCGSGGGPGMGLAHRVFPAHCPQPSHPEPLTHPIALSLFSAEKSGDHFLKTHQIDPRPSPP